MYVCELIKPGSFICHEDREHSWKFENLIRYLESLVCEANVSLNLFTEEYNKAEQFKIPSYDEVMADFKKRKDLGEEIRHELGSDFFEDITFEVDVRLKREKWRNGVMPASHRHRLLFIFAKSFLYSLDAICRFIKVISEQSGAPEKTKELNERISECFPHLRAVRNSAQHLDERACLKGAFGKRLDPKGVSNESYNVPPGTLMLDNLNGSKFGTTMADGHYGEIDVTQETLEIIRDIVQEVIYSFQWEGAKEFLPR
ncbi:TPA: hypothetical protein ACJIWN_000822 [Enterobacter cloacae]